jgi:hypothetical protein
VAVERQTTTFDRVLNLSMSSAEWANFERNLWEYLQDSGRSVVVM